MDAEITIKYDSIGDILMIDLCPMYSEQDEDTIDDEVVAKFNPETGEIENLDILFFKSWLKQEGEMRLPINATLRSATDATPVSAPAKNTGQEIIFTYDVTGDTLAIDKRRPYPGQPVSSLSLAGEGQGDAIARLNPKTGEIESLQIAAFFARLEQDGAICLPVSATLRAVETAAVSAQYPLSLRGEG